MSPALLGATVLVGVASGIVGAAYLLAFHVLQHVLWPDHWSNAAEFAVLGATGVAVVVIGSHARQPGRRRAARRQHPRVGHRARRAHAAIARADVAPHDLGRRSGRAGGAARHDVRHARGLGRARRHLSVDEARCVTIAGMAAAFTVLFGAPLGSALFALEILHRRGMQYTEALLPAILGALVGLRLLRRGDGRRSRARVAHPGGRQATQRRPLVGGRRRHRRRVDRGRVHVSHARVASVFRVVPPVLRPDPRRARARRCSRSGRRTRSPSARRRPATCSPRRLSVGVLAVAVVAKLLGTSLTVSSGWPGGFIIPLFFIGATVGQLTHHVFAAAPVGVVCAALMVAANVGVTKTMLGSTLIVTEMGGLRLLPTTLIAATIAFILTSEVGLIHSQRERSPRVPPDAGRSTTERSATA